MEDKVMMVLPETDLSRFLRATDRCDGEVILQFYDGSRLNVKSMLSKVVLAALYEKKELLKDAEIICEKEADEQFLREFLGQEG